MKNITLSADMHMIEQAREIARSHKSTLNNLFRAWLAELVGQREREKRLEKLDIRLKYVQPGRKFSRQEMNER